MENHTSGRPSSCFQVCIVFRDPYSNHRSSSYHTLLHPRHRSPSGTSWTRSAPFFHLKYETTLRRLPKFTLFHHLTKSKYLLLGPILPLFMTSYPSVLSFIYLTNLPITTLGPLTPILFDDCVTPLPLFSFLSPTLNLHHNGRYQYTTYYYGV